MKKLILITGFLIFGLSATVMAQTETPRTDTRQKAQRSRIHEGREDGEVTNPEAAVLNAEQRHIRRSERRMKADGEVTPAEKAKLEKKQDRASRHIRKAKTNDKEK